MRSPTINFAKPAAPNAGQGFPGCQKVVTRPVFVRHIFNGQIEVRAPPSTSCGDSLRKVVGPSVNASEVLAAAKPPPTPWEPSMTPMACVKTVQRCTGALGATVPCVCGSRKELARYKTQLRTNVENSKRLVAVIKKSLAAKRGFETTISLGQPLLEAQQKRELVVQLETCSQQQVLKSKDLKEMLEQRRYDADQFSNEYHTAARRVRDTRHRIADLTAQIATGVKNNVEVSISLNHEENDLLDLKQRMKDVEQCAASMNARVGQAVEEVEQWRENVEQLESMVSQATYAKKSFLDGGNKIKTQALHGIESLEQMDKSLDELEKRVNAKLASLQHRDDELESKWQGLAEKESSLANKMNRNIDELEEVVDLQKAALRAHEHAWQKKTAFLKAEIARLESHTSIQNETTKELERAILQLRAMPERHMKDYEVLCAPQDMKRAMGLSRQGVRFASPSASTNRPLSMKARSTVPAGSRATSNLPSFPRQPIRNARTGGLNVEGDANLSRFIIGADGLAEICEILDPECPEMEEIVEASFDERFDAEAIKKGAKSDLPNLESGRFFEPAKKV